MATTKPLRHTPAVRLFHWLHAISTLLLVLTGLNISYPDKRFGFSSLSQSRRLHLATASFFVASYVARVYYALISGDWRNIMFRPRDMVQLPALISFYLLRRPVEPSYGKYNPGEKLLFTLWKMVIIPLTIIIGCALTWPERFPHLIRRFGGLSRIRQRFFLTAVALAASAAVHMYLALSSGPKRLASIFTGQV